MQFALATATQYDLCLLNLLFPSLLPNRLGLCCRVPEVEKMHQSLLTQEKRDAPLFCEDTVKSKK